MIQPNERFTDYLKRSEKESRNKQREFEEQQLQRKYDHEYEQYLMRLHMGWLKFKEQFPNATEADRIALTTPMIGKRKVLFKIREG
jgi:hypothetical protein